LHHEGINPRLRSKFQMDGRTDGGDSRISNTNFDTRHGRRTRNARGSVGTGALKPSQNKARVSYVTEVGGTRRT